MNCQKWRSKNGNEIVEIRNKFSAIFLCHSKNIPCYAGNGISLDKRNCSTSIRVDLQTTEGKVNQQVT